MYRKRRTEHHDHQPMSSEEFIHHIDLPTNMQGMVIPLREVIATLAGIDPSEVCPTCNMRELAKRVRPMFGDGFDAFDLIFLLEKKLSRAIDMKPHDFPIGLNSSVKYWFELVIPAVVSHMVH